MKRRQFLQGAASGIGATLSMPAFLRSAAGQSPIKIGIPTTFSGTFAIYGEQTKRGADFFSKEINAKGGVLGRPIKLIYEDTSTNPAIAIRKAQQLVEKDGVKFLTGVVASSEALAISPKCPEWNCLFIGTIPGAGALTTTAFNRNFFRVNVSAIMGSRITSLYLKQSPLKRFYGIGSDYAYGHDSVATFSKLIGKLNKQTVGTAFPPIGTKDFASFITKMKESGAEACLVTLAGQDLAIFIKQAHQFGLNRSVKLLVESFQISDLDTIGDAMEGVIGVARYVYTIDNPKNKKFVESYHAMYNAYPDYPDATVYEALDWLCQTITNAGTAENLEKIISAWEDTTYDGLRGQVFMRKCDHQVAQEGFMAEAVKNPNGPGLIPKILAVYPRDQVTPMCRSSEFSD